MRFGGGDVHGKAEDEQETIDGREPRASAAAPGELITGGGDGLAKLWDAAKGKLIGVRDAHGTAINSLAISADGNTVWAGCESRAQGAVRAWDIHVETRAVGRL